MSARLRLVSLFAASALLCSAASVRADALALPPAALTQGQLTEAAAAPAAPVALASTSVESSSPATAAATVRSSSPAGAAGAARRSRRAPAPGADQELPERGLAVGVSFPVRFFAGDIGVSLSYGFARHYAVRANFASFTELGPLDFDSEASHSGRSTDVGAGLVWYPRRLWSGPTFELGALARTIDRKIVDEDDTETTDTSLVAGRALLGWSWRYKEAFLAVAVGCALGYERGTESFAESPDDMPPVEKRVRRLAGDGEFYFRAGFVFGK